MKISELRSGQGNVDVEGVIKEIGEGRKFNKFGRELVVANAILEDDSGSIKLTLWNQDVGRFKEGDHIKIVSGYVNEFQGENQLTSGKFGRIEKVSDNITKSEESAGSSKSPKASKKKTSKVSEESDVSDTASDDSEEESNEDVVSEEDVI